MGEEVVVHLYNETLLSQNRNKFEAVVVRYMNLEPLIQSEVSQEDWLDGITYLKDREAWHAAVHGGTESQTRLSD